MTAAAEVVLGVAAEVVLGLAAEAPVLRVLEVVLMT